MKALCILVGLLGATIIASLPPDFSPDSQMYIQSGIVWARGDVTYAGSLVGSRILAILYYHLPLAAFGPSIDAISLALGFTFFSYAVLISAWCFKEIPSTAIATVTALAVIIIGFVWLPWNYPLTEQLALVVILATLYLLALSRTAKTSARWLLLVTAAAMAGIGTGVRSELTILFVVIAGSLLFDLSKRLRARIIIFSAMVVAFAITAQVPALAFAAFTGKPMPPQLPYYFLFHQAMHEFGDAKNGPASSELAALGSKIRPSLAKPEQMSDVRLGIGPSFIPNGGAGTNRLARDAGLETISARPWDFTRLVIDVLHDYLSSPAGVLVDRRSYEERWRSVTDEIKAIDIHRAASSARFGGDVAYPVASLYEQRLTSMSPMLGGLPIVDVHPAGWHIAVLGLVVLLLSTLERDFTAPSSIAAAYFFACLLLASFSQGYITRYYVSASLPLVVVFAIDVGRRLSRRLLSDLRHADSFVPAIVASNAPEIKDRVVE